MQESRPSGPQQRKNPEVSFLLLVLNLVTHSGKCGSTERSHSANSGMWHFHATTEAKMHASLTLIYATVTQWKKSGILRRQVISALMHHAVAVALVRPKLLPVSLLLLCM
jgi:hypothetical protein